MKQPRSADELAVVDNPAWPGLLEAVANAEVPVAVLDVARGRGMTVLHRLQVSAASGLGALALNCGGLVVDHGWLRVLGGGTTDLPDLAQVNGLGDPGTASTPPPWLVVAYDVLGGMFAVDGGGLGVNPGEVCYRGPDTLRWEGLGAGHGGFLEVLLAGGLGDFYAPLRWSGWEQEATSVGLGHGLSLYPPPFSSQGQDFAAASKRPVPFQELLDFYDSAAAQVADMPEGAAFEFRME